MRFLITRPALQAHQWADKLRAAGIDAVPLPLIHIEARADAAEVRLAWAELASQNLVFFGSPNAVVHFFALEPSPFSWPQGLKAASPGPGTTQALIDFGVPSALIIEPPADAPQFDSEALWQRLEGRDWAQANVLVVRGSSGRDWLADRLRDSGANLNFVATYRRAPPILDQQEQVALAKALAQPQQHVWVFSSSAAIEHLRALVPGADWSQARALATHPRIAESARGLGMIRISEANPSFAAVVACIQSISS